jgi:ribose transport system ATP-binding protein
MGPRHASQPGSDPESGAGQYDPNRGAAADASDALVARDVRKTFGATRALRGVDLVMRPAEVLALVGQNGCGKSTLVKLLAGFHEPDSATQVECHGRTFALGDAAAAHAAGLRFVHQDLGVVPALNTMDNLALGFGYACGAGRRIKWREQNRAAREALDALGYGFDVSVPLIQLAPVERTAVSIARALQGIDPKSSVLVLDEPTATMPRPEVERMFGIIHSLRSAGVSVLYVSHHLNEVYAISDRITVMRDGELIDTRPTAELPRHELAEMIVGHVIDTVTSEVSEAAGPVVLELEKLTTSALRGIDLQVREGEIVGVAGLTGSGREQLCDAVFGGIRRAGTVRVKGRELEAMRPDLMVRHRVGLVPADRRELGIFETMTLRENFTIPDVSQYSRRLFFRHRAERRDVERLSRELRVKAAGTETGIDALSGGNQQKVVVGRWLRLEPTVLLLDEPTQGVDIGAKADIHQLIDHVAATGTAVLVCSTDEAELERLCHRVIVLRDGHVAIQLPRSGASAARIVRETLGVGDRAEATSARKVAP